MCGCLGLVLFVGSIAYLLGGPSDALAALLAVAIIAAGLNAIKGRFATAP